MTPQKIFLKLGALRSLLRPYLYPNATSPTRVHGESNTSVRHDTRQSSRGVYSRPYVAGLMRWASYRRIDDLDKNSFYFVLHSETSSVITTPNSLKGGAVQWQCTCLSN